MLPFLAFPGGRYERLAGFWQGQLDPRAGTLDNRLLGNMRKYSEEIRPEKVTVALTLYPVFGSLNGVAGMFQ